MHLHIFPHTNELSRSLADWIVDYISTIIENKGRFTIALSGGSTPQQLHALLAAPPYRDKINWALMHIFWGDERAVPFEDERNNARMAYDTY
jgi:6-phosphogluconolactonase